MSVEISDYVNVEERALELGCNNPTGVSILPRNFDKAKNKEELLYESSVPTVRVLLRQAGIKVEGIEKEGDKIPYKVEQALEWVGPILFFSVAELSKNPELVAISIGVISDYLADWFKGLMGKKNVKLDIVKEIKEGVEYKKIHYEGSVDGLNKIPEIIQEVMSDE